jgi:hypothetical protein
MQIPLMSTINATIPVIQAPHTTTPNLHTANTFVTRAGKLNIPNADIVPTLNLIGWI